MPKGKYVLAVSGGVDSVSLLRAAKDLPGVVLVVAHFDHGIRADSGDDRLFVERLAGNYGLPFVYKEGGLGRSASEAEAREARYRFLHDIRREQRARAIVTAHHRDDVLETAVINLLRGSGRKGLTALSGREHIERPLLDIPKSEILAYAEARGLEWREDSTNRDTDYLRNYVRHRLLPRFDDADRQRLWEIITGLRTTNAELDGLIAGQLAAQPGAGKLDRGWFIGLPHAVAVETLAAWLRGNGLRDFDKRTLERLAVAAKTAAAGKTFDVFKGTVMSVGAHDLALRGPDRWEKNTGKGIMDIHGQETTQTESEETRI